MAQTRLLLPRFVTHEAVEANVLNWWRCFLNLHEQYIDLAGPPYKWMWYKCITWICNMLKNIDDGRKTRTDPTYLRKSCKLIIAVWQRWTTAVRDQANCIYLDRLIPYVHHVQEEGQEQRHQSDNSNSSDLQMTRDVFSATGPVYCSSKLS